MFVRHGVDRLPISTGKLLLAEGTAPLLSSASRSGPFPFSLRRHRVSKTYRWRKKHQDKSSSCIEERATYAPNPWLSPQEVWLNLKKYSLWNFSFSWENSNNYFRKDWLGSVLIAMGHPHTRPTCDREGRGGWALRLQEPCLPSQPLPPAEESPLLGCRWGAWWGKTDGPQEIRPWGLLCSASQRCLNRSSRSRRLERFYLMNSYVWGREKQTTVLWTLR